MASLPSDVASYVDRHKVPTINYVEGPAKSVVHMTFDTPLHQHAFALAVTSDADHSGGKAVSVVLKAVHTIFGASTTIAPTPVAANGEKVLPTQRMSPQQLSMIKKQIAMQNAGISDEDDPWMQPVPTQSDSQPLVAPVARARTSAARLQRDTQPQRDSHPQQDTQPAAGTQSPAHSAIGQDRSDDDEYTLHDPALHEEPATMDVDEVAAMFEAKDITEYAADDPKNPRNIQRINRQRRANAAKSAKSGRGGFPPAHSGEQKG